MRVTEIINVNITLYNNSNLNLHHPNGVYRSTFIYTAVLILCVCNDQHLRVVIRSTERKRSIDLFPYNIRSRVSRRVTWKCQVLTLIGCLQIFSEVVNLGMYYGLVLKHNYIYNLRQAEQGRRKPRKSVGGTIRIEFKSDAVTKGKKMIFDFF